MSTFVVCGALHDPVTMVIKGSVTFLFTPWFLMLGVGVILGRWLGLDFSSYPWAVRATIIVSYIGACLTLAIMVRRLFSIP